MKRGERNASAILKNLSGLFALLTGLTAIASALWLYFGSGGEQPYTALSAGRCLRILAIPASLFVCAALAAAIAGRKEKESFSGAAVHAMPCKKPSEISQKRLLWLRLAVLAAAAVLLLTGILNGGATDVFIKASKICSECIGLG